MIFRKQHEISIKDLTILISQQNILIKSQVDQTNKLLEQSALTNNLLLEQASEITRLGAELKTLEVKVNQVFDANQLDRISHRFRRNFLPNDSSLSQKTLMAIWQAESKSLLGYKDILGSGFRVFSQNDEDGMLLRIFSHIGYRNQCVVEIGSNCSDSDIGIPENLSTNLIVNHGWHGVVFEIDQVQCGHIQHFFARDFSTKHFHMQNGCLNRYFSPLIIQNAIYPENVEQVLLEANNELEPDLMVIDIDGGDYAIVSSIKSIRPRVMVVEFEKRFRDRHSVVQTDVAEFGKRWPQSGAASLLAWENLMASKGYTLIAIGTCGFNAFFVRSDIATDKFSPLNSRDAFNSHPILSQVSEDFGILPDESWKVV